MKDYPPIVLLTDFSLQDPYAGILKAVICRIHPGLRVFDLCHGVPPYDIVRAACFLEDSYHYYPHGTCFVCVVDPGVGARRKILCAKAGDYYFISPDNGLLGPVLRHERKSEIRWLKNERFFLRENPSATFHGRDRMAPSAAHLVVSRYRIFPQLGPRLKSIVWLKELAVKRIPGRKLQGTILYFDTFGNGITNVRSSDEALSFWRHARIRVKKFEIGKMRRTYAESPKGLIPLINSFGRLEIAWPKASAKIKGRLKEGDPVTAEWAGL